MSPKKKFRSIRGKLDRLVITSVGLALLVVLTASLWQEANRYLTAKRDILIATAQVFGAATSEAVARRDPTAVRAGLRAIAQIPDLLRVEVRDQSGAVLADLGSSARLSEDAAFSDAEGGIEALRFLRSHTVQATAPVTHAGSVVGQVVLLGDATDLVTRFWGVIGGMLPASAIAVLVGLALAHRLQRSLTAPLSRLTEAMSTVEERGMYAPVEVSTNDETGILADRFNSMIREIRRATDELLTREAEIIERLARAGERRDDQTGQHVVRVAKVSGIIARELGLDPKWIHDLCRASPMHDVGKISIPDAILFKPGRLDPEERACMEQHAMAGYEVLAGSSSQLVQLAAEIAISHHEKWDGTGYPNKIAGEAIPLSGRITAVGDVCDALLSERPYKKPWTLAAVKEHLTENAGAHFDPKCVDALLARWSELEEIYTHDPERLAA